MKRKLISLKLDIGSYKSFIESITSLAATGKSSYVCVANVHMLIEANIDNDFADIVNNADMVTPDGVPLTWGLKLIHNIEQDRVAGMDLLPDLLTQFENKKMSVYFYGGTKAVLDKTVDFISEFYPDLNVVGICSPPFRPLTAEEEKQIIENINKSKAHVVFVALGCPKQEKWMASMKGLVNSCMIGVGGALPVMVKIQKRAPLVFQKMGMEWFYRLAQEPRRLFKRYLVTNSMFIWLLFKASLNRSKYQEN